jgi:GT2 family glycosyltransferase
VISVVMPAYNAAPYLARAVNSILGQTFADLELIVVDDGSTDGTATIARMYADRDPRVRVIDGAHGGISAAINRGINEASRPWIARMDADDVAVRHRLERQMAAAAAEPGVVLWGSYALHVNDAGKVLGLSRTGPTTVAQFEALRAAGADAYILHPTWLVRREVLIAAGGYDSKFDACEDFELLDRIAEHGPTLTIPEPLLLYRIHSASVSMTQFATGRRWTEYVRQRRQARLAGRSLSVDEFTRQLSARSALSRSATAVRTASAFSYRRAGLSFAGGRPMNAAAWFALAATLNPVYAARRLWHQVLSDSARRFRAEEIA